MTEKQKQEIMAETFDAIQSVVWATAFFVHVGKGVDLEQVVAQKMNEIIAEAQRETPGEECSLVRLLCIALRRSHQELDAALRESEAQDAN